MKLVDSLSPYINVLSVTGTWGHDFKFSKIHSLISVSLFNGVHLLTLLIHMILNLQQLGSSVHIFLILAVSLGKFYFVRKYAKVNKLLLELLNTEEFTPKICQESMVKSRLRMWKFWCILYNGGSVAALLLILSYALLDGKEWGLPYDAWYPFNYKCSPAYELTYCYQVVSMCNICAINICSDSYFTGLMCHIAIQCEILADNLKNMNLYTKERLGRKAMNKYELERSFNDCLKHYVLILEFSKNVHILTNYTVFYQFAAELVSYSMSLLYLAKLSPLVSEFWTTTVYILATFIQLSGFSWRGNEVLMQSLRIPAAAFECGWEDCSQAMKKDLIFFIARTQKPIEIRALNFFILSFSTFISILRSSYSYFAVLQQYNDN